VQRVVSAVKFIAERGLAFRDDENVGSPRRVFKKKFQSIFQAKFQKKEDAMLLVTDIATISQIANHCQISCCIISFVTLELTNGTSQDYVSLCERHNY